MNVQLRGVIGACHGHHACPYLPVVDYRLPRGGGVRLCKQHLDLWLDLADDSEAPEPAGLVWLFGAPPLTLA